MANAQTKARLEVLKTKIAISSEILNNGFFSPTDLPNLKDFYRNELEQSKEVYLELLRDELVPNKTYVMDMENPILPYDDENHIVSFLYDNMIYGEYKDDYSYGDDYLFDINTPFAKHIYKGGGETMEDNRAEIIECLHASPFTFLVDNDGNTIINGRPFEINHYLVPYSENDKINVVSNKNIFNTDLIANISLSSL